jgi:tRNA dimethylallyltransferase
MQTNIIHINPENDTKKPKVILVGGPTASGKTKLSIDLAQGQNGEIISADSRQIFIGLNIGTAKIAPRPSTNPSTPLDQLYKTPFLAEGVPHYLIDIVYPNQPYTVFDFKQQATEIIYQILQKGKTPIVVGGTGLYLDALINNYTHTSPTTHSEKLKTELQQKFDQLLKDHSTSKAKQIMHQGLASLDPLAAAKIPSGNIYQVLRATEFALLNPNQSKLSSAQASPSPFQFEFHINQPDRKQLYQTIEDRIDQQLQDGLVQETESLIQKYGLDCPALSSIGYKEINSYLQGQSTYQDAINLFKQKTRNYAKRQVTWFKRYASN